MKFKETNLLDIKFVKMEASEEISKKIQAQKYSAEDANKCKEIQTQQNADNAEITSNVEIFNAVLQQVSNTPQEQKFFKILQGLLNINSEKSNSDQMWDTTEKLLNLVIKLENNKTTAKLLHDLTDLKFTCAKCNGSNGGYDIEGNTIKATKEEIEKPVKLTETITPPTLPPPPPPPLPSLAPPPPPPPAMQILSNPASLKLPAKNIWLPQQITPEPNKKLKILSWDKIAPHEVLGKTNIWTKVAKNHANDIEQKIKWQEVESLFSLSSPVNPNQSPSRFNKSSELTKIHLLDVQSSMHIDICLKQLKGTDIVKLIQNGDHKTIGAEKLKALLKSLPDESEQEILKNYNGDFERLAEAEQFLIKLMKVSSCKLRIEAMIIKDEFAGNILYLRNAINSLIKAGDDLLNNKSLHEVLYIIVLIGNFLNSGIYAGKAVGIKLTSLNKLGSLRSNKCGLNFMNFIVNQVENRNAKLSNFVNELGSLEPASKLNLDQISEDIRNLNTRVHEIKSQLELPNSDEDFQNQMTQFIHTAEIQLNDVFEDINKVESMRLKLCDFFCEKLENFKLEDCFKIFQLFIAEFKQAIKTNDRLKQLEESQILRQTKKTNTLGANSMRGSMDPNYNYKFNKSLLDINNDFRDLETFTANGERSSIPSIYVHKPYQKRSVLAKVQYDNNRERPVSLNLKELTLTPNNYDGQNRRACKKEDTTVTSKNLPDKELLNPTSLKENISNNGSSTSRPMKGSDPKSSNQLHPNHIGKINTLSSSSDAESPIKSDVKRRESLRRAEQIGRRYSSIGNSELQAIRGSLNKTKKSLWDRPREEFMGNIVSNQERKVRRLSSINKADLQDIRKNLKPIKESKQFFNTTSAISNISESKQNQSSHIEKLNVANNQDVKLRRLSSTNKVDLKDVRKNLKSIKESRPISINDNKIYIASSNISINQYQTPEPMPKDWKPLENFVESENEIEIKRPKSKTTKETDKQKSKDKSCIIS